MCAGDFAAFNTLDSLALEAVEVLSEAAAVGEEVVPLNKEHEESVDFIEGIEDPKEVAGMTVSGQGKHITNGRWKEGGELLFGEEFCR